MQKVLTRRVGTRVRYYKIVLQKTLFGKYVLERIYGNIYNKRPTGCKREFFEDLAPAQKAFQAILRSKRRKGYKEVTINHLSSSSLQ